MLESGVICTGDSKHQGRPQVDTGIWMRYKSSNPTSRIATKILVNSSIEG
jgi:hypothetical protein